MGLTSLFLNSVPENIGEFFPPSILHNIEKMEMDIRKRWRT